MDNTQQDYPLTSILRRIFWASYVELDENSTSNHMLLAPAALWTVIHHIPKCRTITNLRNSYVPEGPGQWEFCAFRYRVCIWSTIFVYTWQSSWNPNSNTLQLHQTQHDRPVSCVIAQQYSSAILLLYSFHSRRENFGARFENVISFFIPPFLNRAVLKLPNLNLRRSGSIYTKNNPCDAV